MTLPEKLAVLRADFEGEPICTALVDIAKWAMSPGVLGVTQCGCTPRHRDCNMDCTCACHDLRAALAQAMEED